jgi:drug/metabolite transporter (DMT)-like permease
VLVIMSSGPLVAALLARIVLGERINAVSRIAVLATLAGITLMVSDSLGRGAIAGDLVALSIALAQAVAVVEIRRNRSLPMTPAMCLATLIAALAVIPFASPLETTARDLALLTLFGAGQLGLGLALFSYGAPLLPAAQTALLNVLEPVLGPLWVWLLVGERPSHAALIGGGVVLAALIAHIADGLRR